MADPAYAANGLHHVADIATRIGTPPDEPHPAVVRVVASEDGVGVYVGDMIVPLTADEAVELADALAEGAATARTLERERDAEAPMVAHARRVVESCLGIRWPG